MREMIGRLDEIAGQLKRIGDALEALSVMAKEERENFPPNTPIKRKEKDKQLPTRACACASQGVREVQEALR